MAATLLNRTTLVRLPHRAAGERAFSEHPLLDIQTPATAARPAQWSATSLEAMPATRRVVLLLDPRDVTLLALKLPPLPARRLVQAVPNLIEDLLLQDPQACAVAPGADAGEGRRLVAVSDKAWLERVVNAFERRGMRVDAVWPEQLTLAWRPGAWSVDLSDERLVLRTGPVSGFGWTLSGSEAEREAAIAAALEVALADAARPECIALCGSIDPVGRSLLEAAAARVGLPLVEGASETSPAPVDLLAGLGSNARSRWAGRIDWRAWRIPAWTLSACVMAWLVGLNLDWAAMARERAALRNRMESTFRQAFPGTQAVVDPLLQMQRRVDELRQGAGRSGPADFLPLLARFSDALGAEGADALIGLDYREGRLRARIKAGLLEDPARQETLRAACLQRGLAIEFAVDAGVTAVIVRVRS